MCGGRTPHARKTCPSFHRTRSQLNHHVGGLNGRERAGLAALHVVRGSRLRLEVAVLLAPPSSSQIEDSPTEFLETILESRIDTAITMTVCVMLEVGAMS